MTKKSVKAASPKQAVNKQATKRKTAPTPPAVFGVVGIGASAGGVEASSEILKHLHPDLGMAYVFIHHLSSKHDSHLAEILQRYTPMPVSKVTEGVKVHPNHVYVIPPDTFMRIQDGHLKLESTARRGSSYNAIDHFLISLAKIYQHNAIGVLLSGTASDGTLGLKEIKESGGITFAQDKSAAHSEMSTHAQNAGYVDYVLPPKRIAEELAALVRHPYHIILPDDDLSKNEKDIKKILSIILAKYGVDFFAHYKRTTIYRRIMRRMALNKIEAFDEYAGKLKDDNNEAYLLYQDFLINVTSFFREEESYNTLTEAVFPRLVKNRQSAESIRIWIAGCATGEEAYSTGICIAEYLDQKKLNVPVQIFSTDLDEKAIEKARLGIYSKNAIQHISPQRLKKFFVKLDGHYQIVKPVRDMCIFSVHNLIKDPPFSRIDLISCRNVLIYIEAAPQRKILHSFHYALKPSGFLLLGKSESIGNASELYQPMEKDSKLYTKKNLTSLPRLDFLVRQHAAVPAGIKDLRESRTETDVEKEFDKLLLSKYVPASLLVNKDLEILRFRGSTARYFEPASGKASLNLLKMVKDELIFELRSLLQKAKKTETVISRSDISFGPDGSLLTIEVAPIRAAKDIYYLIAFKENITGTVLPELKKPKGTKREQQAKQVKLEQALKDAREHIRTITEDFDVNRVELQSANEEILSANEELQSINEELETSKEELQSSNEELTTINEELQNRLAELKEAKDYIEAIVATIHGPLLVLNEQLRIRTANNAFYNFFKLDPEETEGRFLFDLTKGYWDIPALRDHLREILSKDIRFRDFEINHNFPRIGSRILVANAHRLVHHGKEDETLVLIAFQDITLYRQASEALMRTQEQLKLALEGGKVGTWMWNIKTNAINGSREEAFLFGKNEESFNRSYAEWEQMVYPDDLEPTREALKRSIQSKMPLDIEYRIVWADKSIHWLLSKANTYYDAKGDPERMVGVNIDITERKRAIEALAESERRFHTMSDNAPVMIWMTDADKRCNFLNRTWLLFTGNTMDDEVGEGWHKGIHPDDSENFLEVFDAAHRDRREFKIDYRLKRHDGEYRWILNHGVPRYAGNDVFIGYIGTCIDINDRIDIERQKDDFMNIASHELKTPVTSIKAYTQILEQKFIKSEDTNSAEMLRRLDGQIDKLTSLINTLLDVARIQSGQMEYENDAIDINHVLQEIRDEIQPAYPKHEIITSLHASGRILGDKARISQVINNLISNAVKYSPDASKVIIHTRNDNGSVVVTIEDFGLGISKDSQEKIFGRFFRVSESAGNRVSGLGLGLYIASQIIKQQGGKIWLESAPEKGSKFSFSLPVV
jgi:two-component system, chemotaxis family, CheB/CheR fusion protein